MNGGVLSTTSPPTPADGVNIQREEGVALLHMLLGSVMAA